MSVLVLRTVLMCSPCVIILSRGTSFNLDFGKCIRNPFVIIKVNIMDIYVF